MATTSTTTESATSPITKLEAFPEPVRLDERFAALKREIIRPEDEAAISSSYERLKEALSAEVERLSSLQQAAIPEVEWADIKANGLPPRFTTRSSLTVDRWKDSRRHYRKGAARGMCALPRGSL